jgi:predicted Fe-Mo cluster-binding NifX family protein
LRGVDDVEGDLPPGIGRPATNALQNAGYVRLDQLDGVPARDVLALHGVGPKAVRLLQEALAARGMRMP